MADELILEGADVRSPDDLHRALAGLLDFTDEYGHTWDALWDVLSDEDLRGVKNPVDIVWRDSALYAERDPHGFEIAQRLFAEAPGVSLQLAD